MVIEILQEITTQSFNLTIKLAIDAISTVTAILSEPSGGPSKDAMLSFAGSLIGATIALLAAGITVYKMSKQILEMRRQLKEMNESERRGTLLKLALMKEEMLLEHAYRDKFEPSTELVKLSIIQAISDGKLPGDRDYATEVDHSAKVVRIRSNEQPLDHDHLIPFSALLEQIITAKTLLGDEEVKARYRNTEDDFFGLRIKVQSATNLYYSFFLLVRELINAGLGEDEAASLLGTTEQSCKILYEIGAVEQILVDQVKLILSIGMFDFRFIKIKMKERWVRELISSKLVSEHTSVDQIESHNLQFPDTREHIFFAWLKREPNRVFVRENKAWRTESRQDTVLADTPP